MASSTRGNAVTRELCESPLADDQPRATVFAERVASMRAELYDRALFLTRDRAAADDLVQDVLERTLSAEATFREGTNLWGWMSAIMRNAFIDGYRHTRTIVRGEREPIVQPPEQDASPLDLISFADVRQEASRLDPSERRLLEMACLEKRPYRDISAELGIVMNTVGSRLFRTRRKLRHVLLRLYRERLAADNVTRLV